MNKTNLLLGAFILSAMFLLGCSSESSEPDKPSSNSVNPSSSSDGTTSSSGGGNSSSSGGGNNVEDVVLNRKPITLDLNKGYADIDEPIAYTKNDAANNVSKIDLVAYCGTDMGCQKNSIYNPYEIDGGDLFWNPGYIGSWIYFFEIPPNQSEVFRTARRLSQISPTYNNLVLAGVIGGYGVNEISIEADKVFYVYTSEENGIFVIIKKVNSQSVDLEIFEMPGN